MFVKKEAKRLNERFFTWITKKRPFISVKYAMTLDGKIAAYTGDSKWITGEAARTYAHRLRRQHDAILVGIGTVQADDPELSTRLVKGSNPVRVILDSHLHISLMANVLNPVADTIIITGLDADPLKAEALNALPNVEVVQLPLKNGHPPIPLVVENLAQRGLTSLWLRVVVKFMVPLRMRIWLTECMLLLHRRFWADATALLP